MNIYHGVHRRQVGAGIWSTISRGIRPIIFSLLKRLKPHAISAANRVAHSAAKVGTELAVDAIHGKLNKDRIKDVVKKEATQLTQDAYTNLKRKLDGEQSGSGYKRRRLNPIIKAKMKKRRVAKQKSTKRRSYSKRSMKRSKGQSKINKRRKSRGITKRKTKRSRVSHKVLKDIFSS